MASPLRPMPLVVLTHGRSWTWSPGNPAAALEALWPLLQENLASLTSDAASSSPSRAGTSFQASNRSW